MFLIILHLLDFLYLLLFLFLVLSLLHHNVTFELLNFTGQNLVLLRLNFFIDGRHFKSFQFLSQVAYRCSPALEFRQSRAEYIHFFTFCTGRLATTIFRQLLNLSFQLFHKVPLAFESLFESLDAVVAALVEVDVTHLFLQFLLF